MSTFSPGPWTASDTRVMASDGTLVCIMGVMSRVEDSALVAAAPDLLAAIKAFLSDIASDLPASRFMNIDDDDPYEEDDPLLSLKLVKALALAVAKAEGQ